ncbi:hypothetical protein [Sphingobium sp. Sx8-8]|uniref:hypothetical protein n=1 Tax=Sphingobium sp. Sx8-8 TaxID=2933617 RepID=UPI001F564E1A|nr:hypothetical protein [Sphingobium sp. Sx8-8]
MIPDKPPVGDTHVHLLNAADLPVEGFLRYVVLPDHLKGFEILWPVLIHLAELLKTNAISAEEEIRHLPSPGASDRGKMEASAQSYSRTSRLMRSNDRPRC